MQIVIGSLNPVKQRAAKNVLGRLFPDASFSALDVPSGVATQPWGDEETRTGAYNRAQTALAQADAQLAIGLEGGVVDTRFGMMTTAWCVVMSHTGTVGVGGGVNVMLPPKVADTVREGIELGLAMDQFVGEHNTKQKQGAIGILTDGLLNRQQAYEVIIQLAVAPFRQPDFYKDLP